MNTLLLALIALFDCDFSHALDGWQVENYEQRAVIEARKVVGTQALAVTRAPTAEKGGSAWQLKSAEFPVKAGARLAVIVRGRGTLVKMNAPNGFKGNYMTCVRWYDATGAELKDLHTGFGLDLNPYEWRYSIKRMIVPARATSARVCLGADTPNIDKKDIVAVSSVTVVQNEEPPSGPHTALRDDGVLLVDGKPFFPIGIYGLIKCEFNGNSYVRGMEALKEAGFNTVQRHGIKPTEEYLEFLDALDQTGMKTFTPPSQTSNSDILREGDIDEVKGRNSILAWYIADDTSSYVTAHALAYRDRMCKALDPTRLTLQADAQCLADRQNRYEGYVHCSDIFLPELYPCHDRVAIGTEVASIVRDMEDIRMNIREAGNPAKGVWPIIQHFDGWGWERFPTYAELRAMSWLGIIHGGKGIIWYTYGARNPKNRGVTAAQKYWQEITSVSREIAAFKDDLLERDASVQPKVEILMGPNTDALGQPSVTALLKSGKRALLIAANASTSPVRARIIVGSFSRVYDFEPYGVQLDRIDAQGEFKIMSFNVCHGSGMDNEVDLARTARRISNEHPRFACLQELDKCTERVEGVDQPNELSHMTGMHATFARAIDFMGGEYGVMMLSREKPLKVIKTPLPGAEPRVLLLCEFDDCVVGTTHLSVAAESERTESIAIIEKTIAPYLGKKPIFLSGDWNSTPESSVLTGLGKFLKVVSDTNCQTFHGIPEAGPESAKDWTKFCIDYIACDHATAKGMKFVDARVIPDRTTSDHAPIVVTIMPSGGAAR